MDKKIILSLLLIVVLVGCQQTTEVVQPPVSPGVENIVKEAEEILAEFKHWGMLDLD